MKRLFCFFIICMCGACQSKPCSHPLEGDWYGTAVTLHEQTRFVLHVSSDGTEYNASVTLSDIGVSRWPGLDVTISNSSISLNLPSDSSKQPISLSLQDEQLIGTWHDAADKQPSELILTKQEFTHTIQEQRIIIQGKAGDIGLSYIIPSYQPVVKEQEQSTPLVILTHGSGPVSRDVNRFIAESFARRGIAAVFYDKRGIGQTEGDYQLITFEQLAEDAIAVAEYFHSTASFSNIGFWGHSQGGWIAPFAASRWQHAKFVIMSAGPMVSPAREAEWGFLYPVKGDDIAKSAVRDIVSAWHDGLRNSNFDHFFNLLGKYEHANWFTHTKVISLKRQTTGTFIESYKLYMDYEPMITFNDMDKPVLAIYSLDDESIDSIESIDLFKQQLSKDKRNELAVYQGYNHSLRRLSDSSRPLRFPNFPPDYFDKQVNFINRVTTDFLD